VAGSFLGAPAPVAECFWGFTAVETRAIEKSRSRRYSAVQQKTFGATIGAMP
jgi:hypothetical protein